MVSIAPYVVSMVLLIVSVAAIDSVRLCCKWYMLVMNMAVVCRWYQFVSYIMFIGTIDSIYWYHIASPEE